MNKRQLFYAKDANGVKINIDDVDKTSDSTGKYTCPFCKEEVVAKCGEKNVWHFAHKDKVCSYLNIKSGDGLSDGKLEFESESSVDLDSVQIGSDCKDFLCVQCKKKFRKDEGLKWNSTEYVCRDCFGKM